MTETEGEDNGRRGFRVLALTFMLAVPSLWVFEKYLSVRMIPVYVLAVAAAAWLWESGRLRRLASSLGDSRARWLAAVIAAGLVVTLPFFLIDPAGFSPLHTRTKLTEVDAALPHAEIIVPALALALSLALARPHWKAGTVVVLRNATVVQAFLVIVATALWVLSGRRPLTVDTAFGTLFLFFGVGAYAAATRTDHRRPVAD